MPPASSRTVFALLLISCLLAVQVSAAGKNCSADPQADPENDPCNPLRYIPSNKLSVIGLSPYLAVGLIHIVSTVIWGGAWMSALTIGCFAYASGLALRIPLHNNPDSIGIYIGMYMLVTLSPCAFIAAEYVLLGRLARYLGEEKQLLVSPRRVTLFFVASDVITFLVQAGGGGISAQSSSNPHNAELGTHIFFIGLILQLVSFVLFSLMFLLFLIRVSRRGAWVRDADLDKSWFSDWRALACAQFISCIGVIIRSVYRVIELSQGFGGPISTNEKLFYLFDTIPLLIAVAVYVPLWPGRFIRRNWEKYESIAMKPPVGRSYP